MSEDSKDRIVVNLSDRFPQIPTERISNIAEQNEMASINPISDEYCPLRVAQNIQKLNQRLTSNGNVLQMDKSLTPHERGLALAQPYLFPEVEAYVGQYKDSIKIIEARETQIKHYGLGINEEDFIYPEISTLIMLGKDLLDKPEVRKQLTRKELGFVEEIDRAYEPTYIDTSRQYAVIVLFQIEEELQNIRANILRGDIDPKDDALKQRLEDTFTIAQSLGANETYIELEVLALYQDVSFLVQAKPSSDAVWYLEVLQHEHFDVEEPSEYLNFSGIPDSDTNIKIVNIINDYIDYNYKLLPHASFKEYAERSLGAIRKLIEYNPNTDEDVITYALFEDFMETINVNGKLDVIMSEELIECFTDDEVSKFKHWKQSSEDNKNGFSEYQDDLRQQLDLFYACKDLMNLYMFNIHLSLPAERHPLIREDIYDAGIAVSSTYYQKVTDGYFGAEMQHVSRQVQEKLTLLETSGLKGTPPPEQGYGDVDIDDPTPPEKPNESKPKLTLV